MLSSKDVNFVGYTYKNFEIVQDANVPGIGKFLHVVHIWSLLNFNFLKNYLRLACIRRVSVI